MPDYHIDEKVDQYNDLLSNMSAMKDTIDAEGPRDKTDELLANAIDLAIQQGRGWGPGEKEAYLEKILDDDFIPPLFATSVEEVEKSGLQEAFTSLIYDGETPTRLMLSFRKKGNDAFQNGKRNQVKNLSYFRTALNHYYEALAWALKIEPLQEGDYAVADTDDPTYNEQELNQERSKICGNIALTHMQLKNWGFVRDESKKALQYDDQNVKAWYRLAKAYQQLQEWEAAGDALEKGLAVEPENPDLLKLQQLLAERIRKARKQRQQRERARAERVSKVKAVWKHASTNKIALGKIPLVSSVEEDEEEESRWHHHMPHSGHLPKQLQDGVDEWVWPCLFLYPSHQHSDFIAQFGESEMLAMRLAEVFPELEEDETETAMPWDHNNEFTCSQLATYFEVHQTARDDIIHPEHVQLLKTQGDTMRFYEASRALKGDEGDDIAAVVTAVARKQLHEQRQAWKRKHGSLWSVPAPNPVVRVHPAVTLGDMLRDERMVVPNFLVTLYIFPEQHPAHDAFIKEHPCVAVLQPKVE